MSGAAHLAIGRAAEQAAATHLQQAGYRIVERNFRARGGELDLVATEGAVLAIIEVRYRASRAYGGPGGSITLHKRRRIVAAARALLAARPELARRPARFDVIEVEGAANRLQCRLLRAAFSL